MGAAAVATVAATAGVVLAAGAGYGIYRLVEKERDAHALCPWCGRGSGLKGDENGNSKAEKGSPTSMEKKDDIRKNGGITVGDYFLRTEEEMVEFALKKSLEDQKFTENEKRPPSAFESNCYRPPYN